MCYNPCYRAPKRVPPNFGKLTFPASKRELHSSLTLSWPSGISYELESELLERGYIVDYIGEYDRVH